ncbi:MAG TPA: transposase [Candidatus Peribacterales bacterium]|nr:transposase [Candidatus Peribacterales bacterium]
MPFDPAIQIRRGAYLPHWTKDGAIYSIHFRLADSIPTAKRKEWEEERKLLMQKGIDSLTKEEMERVQYLFSEKIEQYLDAGYGACWLKQEAIAAAIARLLQKFDGDWYRLFAWCIMPNHIHVVFQPLTKPLHQIVQTWKRVSAQKANKLLRRSGTFWQPEYFDHLIRDEEKFEHAVEYVWKNPDAAGFREWKWRWKV